MIDQQKDEQQKQVALSTPIRGLLTVAIALFAIVGVVSAATTLRDHYLPSSEERGSESLDSNGKVSGRATDSAATPTSEPTKTAVTDTAREIATSQTSNQRQQPAQREPENKEVSVFLSHAGRTISCPEQHAEAVKNMDTKISAYWDDIYESIDEGQENWDSCNDNCEEFSEESKARCKEDLERNERYYCSKYTWDGLEPDGDKYEKCLEDYGNKYGSCLDEKGEEYRECLDSCKEIYTPAVQMFSSDYDHIHSSIDGLKDSIENYCGEYTDTND